MEKTMPWGDRMGRFVGTVLVVCGVVNLVRMT
jgi:hypothetical protein